MEGYIDLSEDLWTITQSLDRILMLAERTLASTRSPYHGDERYTSALRIVQELYDSFREARHSATPVTIGDREATAPESL